MGPEAKEGGGARPAILAMGVASLLVVAGAVAALAIAGGAEPEAASPAPARPAAAPTAAPRPPPGKGLKVIDLAAELERLQTSKRDDTDIVRFFLQTPRASVHLHVLGRTQRVPMHLHRNGAEATFVLSGRPGVRHAWGDGERADRPVDPGALVISPPHCGHEWRNPRDDAQQANLVFAVPPFEGNLYVLDDDPRLTQGAPPTVLPPPTSPLPREVVPGLSERVERLAADGPVELPGRPGTTLLLVTSGRATVSGADDPRAHPVRAPAMVAIPPGAAASLRPEAGALVVAYVLRPDLAGS